MSERVLNMPGGQSGAALEAMRSRLQARRKRTNAVALTLSLAAMAFGLFWLVWILYTTLHLGIGGLSVELFTEMTPPPNTRRRWPGQRHRRQPDAGRARRPWSARRWASWPASTWRNTARRTGWRK